MTSGTGKRVVVLGATGNIGTAVVRALGADPSVRTIVGVARRMPGWRPQKTEWVTADLRTDDLTDVVAGADAVIHVAWMFHPARDPKVTWNANVEGTLRLLETLRSVGCPALLYASSVGAYSPRDSLQPVGEDWPTHGWPEAPYTREKAYNERVLDIAERDQPELRIVRMRPGFVFQRSAASEQRRIFVGPFLPQRLVRSRLVPVVPTMDGLVLQVVHADDVAEAFRLALERPVRGAFNLAADPVLTPEDLAGLLDARTVNVGRTLARRATAALFHAHVVPSPPGMFDALLRLPVMDTQRARDELGWVPRHDAVATMREFLDGLRERAGADTPPLQPSTARGRLREFGTGVGARS